MEDFRIVDVRFDVVFELMEALCVVNVRSHLVFELMDLTNAISCIVGVFLVCIVDPRRTEMIR
jgi:hypothetical protein